MIGIILVSHGKMAAGMLDSAKMFFGDSGTSQISIVSLNPSDTPEVFDSNLQKAITEVDTGDGILILADLFGGTPCNRATLILSEKVHVISGMNLAMLIELLGLRSTGIIDYDALANTGKDGIQHLNKIFTES